MWEAKSWHKLISSPLAPADFQYANIHLLYLMQYWFNKHWSPVMKCSPRRGPYEIVSPLGVGS
jgi:hypothetical protein